MPSYNKLVRDEIPQIINHNGKKCLYEILDNNNYALELRKKLDEEITEYIEAENYEDATEELADVLEVINAYASIKGVSMETAENVRKKKAAERGGFSKKIFLIDVIEGNHNE